MTTLLHAAQLLADSTATPTPDPVPDIKPIKPPFVTQLFHRGVVLWWIAVVVGVLALGAAAIDRMTGARRIPSGAQGWVIAGGVGLLGFGVLFLVLSY